MVKTLKLSFAFICVSILLSGVGYSMITNTNQSADYIRLMNRNATLDLDAALFNPAGLGYLESGSFLYLSSQTIWQTRTVSVFDPVYNKDKYSGKTFVPAFPNVYYAHKNNNLTLFAGFMPIGGGGSAKFDDGLPSFDQLLAVYVGTQGVTGYSVNASFTGSSVYYAGQLGAAYRLNPGVSLAIAFRYVAAVNSYEGSLTDATLYIGTTPVTGLVPNITVDSKRTGSGFTEVFSIDLRPSEKLNVGLRFEPMTKLSLVSETTTDETKGVVDSVGMFPDGATYHADIPGQMGAGLSYWVTPMLRAELGFNYWLNTAVNWDGAEKNVVNDFNTGLGLEYSLNDAMKLSVGYLFASTGAKDAYNTDLDYSLASSTLGAGLNYRLNPGLALSLGVSNTFYMTGKNDKSNPFYKQEYGKTAFVIAFGLSKTL